MNRTTTMVGVVIILCAGSLMWLQGRFDKSDLEKSVRLVQNFRIEGRSESFSEFLSRRHGGDPGHWSSRVTGGCRGIAQVSWTVGKAPPAVYQWDVDLPAQTIHPTPASPDGEELLKEFVTVEKQELPPLELPPLGAPDAASE